MKIGKEWMEDYWKGMKELEERDNYWDTMERKEGRKGR